MYDAGFFNHHDFLTRFEVQFLSDFQRDDDLKLGRELYFSHIDTSEVYFKPIDINIFHGQEKRKNWLRRNVLVENISISGQNQDRLQPYS